MGLDLKRGGRPLLAYSFIFFIAKAIEEDGLVGSILSWTTLEGGPKQPNTLSNMVPKMGSPLKNEPFRVTPPL